MGSKSYFESLREAQLSKYRDMILEFLEEVRGTPSRTVLVAFLPSVENTVSAGIITSSLEASGMRVLAYPAHAAPKEPRAPTICIDLEPRGTGLEIYVGRPIGRRLPRSIEIREGLPSLLALIMDEIAPLNDYSRLAAVASAYVMGRDTGERRDLVGLDREAVSRFSDIAKSFTLLVYRVEREPLAPSIARTVLPYYPGLTGSEEAARRVLEEASINPDLIYGRVEDEDTISSLLNLLVSTVSREYRGSSKDPRSLIAGITYYHVGPHEIWDARELASILESIHYSWGPGQIFLYTVMGSEKRIYWRYMAGLLPRIVELVEHARGKPGKLREIRLAGRKAWMHVDAGIGDPLSIVARILRMLGLVEEGRPLMAGVGKAVPLDEALRAKLYPLPEECVAGYEAGGAWIKMRDECVED